MGIMMGANPLAVIFGTVPGAVAALAGAALLIAGLRWNRRLIVAAMRTDPLAGGGGELLALALSGGIPPERGFRLVENALSRAGISVSLSEARQTVDTATRVGVPVNALLRAEAERLRRLTLSETLRRAALLGNKLLAPLALCFLPAFVLVGVVPLVLGIIRNTLTAL